MIISLTPGACWCPRTKPAPPSSPPATQHPMGDVEGIHEGRAPQQRQGKPASVVACYWVWTGIVRKGEARPLAVDFADKMQEGRWLASGTS